MRIIGANKTKANRTFPVLAVGASAGGLEAFTEILAELGDQPDLAIVYIQHLEPSGEKLLLELLRQSTTIPVKRVRSWRKLKPNTLYLCPPRTRLDFTDGTIRAGTVSDDNPLTVIDHCFYGVAEDLGERGIGLILSGTGSDGTLGLKAISDRGGLTIAQEPESANHASMPRSAATTGVADHVLAPREIAREILDYTRHLSELDAELTSGRLSEEIADAIPAMSNILLRVTKHNFLHYKTNTLVRRIQRRMQLLKINRPGAYVALLQQNEDEVQALFRELLIGVTTFFRDPDAFQKLKDEILPELFRNRSKNDCVRIWAPGCANGSEAYSLAILCAEIRGGMDDPCDVQIFATDIDERALQIAREGIYPSGIADHVSAGRLKRFFFKRGKRYQVKKEIRELVLFSSHNLISDPPYSRQDLIVCRNLLIYLGPHLQKKLIPLFHYALRPSGYLFLGPSESLSHHAELFRSVDVPNRISQRRGAAAHNPQSLGFRASAVHNTRIESDNSSDLTDLTAIAQRIVLSEFSPAYVVVDDAGQVKNSSHNLQKYVHLTAGDYQNNIFRMAAKGLRVGLRVAMTEAKTTRRQVNHDNLSIQIDGQIQRVMLTVQPMPQVGEDEQLLMVVFHDVGLPISTDRSLAAENTSSDASPASDALIAQMELELETARADLDKTLQDMEATNEELKSSNEELLSMNEELQSTNEELETSKEEIRSTSAAVSHAHSDLQNLLRSSKIAAVFLDQELNIRTFTPAIAPIYDLLPTDIGRSIERFAPLVTDMPKLPSPTSLNPGDVVEDTVITNDNQAYLRRVLPYETESGEPEGIIVTFNDVTELRNNDNLLRRSLAASDMDAYRINLLSNTASRIGPLKKRFHWPQKIEEFTARVHPEDRPTLPQLDKTVTPAEPSYDVTYRYLSPEGEYEWLRDNAEVSFDSNNRAVEVVGTTQLVTHLKQAEENLFEREAHLRRVINHQLGLVGLIDTHGNLLEVDDGSLAIAGIKREDVIGRHFADCPWWTHDDSVAREMRTTMRRAFSGENVRYDVEVFAGGQGGPETRLWIDFMMSPVRDDNGEITYLIPSGVDISERKRTEEALRESQQRFALAAEAAGMHLTVWNRATGKANWDDSLSELLGLHPSAEQTSEFFYSKTHPEDLARITEYAEQSAREGGTYNAEYRVYDAAGDVRWLTSFGHWVEEPDGERVKLISLTWDITERKLLEQNLRSNEQRIRLAAEAAGFGTFAVDVANNNVEWSREMKRLVGLDPDAPTNGSFAEVPDFVHENDREALSAHLTSVLNDTSNLDHEFQHRIVLPNGRIRQVLMHSRTTVEGPNDKLKVTSVIGTLRDVSEQHRYEQSLKRERARALSASESKTEFLANMSHEIRTPMTAVLGYTDLLFAKETNDEKLQHLHTIRRNGSFLLELINDILDLSKIEAGKVDVDNERCIPHEIVADVISLMEVRAQEKDLRLNVSYAGLMPAEISSDAKRLKQILVNLLGNAIKFTQSGQIDLNIQCSDGAVEFAVVDTGIGISAENLQDLFEPFSQADASVSRSFGGTGLGLAISQRLARMLGGEITVESHLGRGSTFRFAIPCGEESALNLIEPITHILDSPTRENSLRAENEEINLLEGRRVLVVDDNPDIRALVRELLTAAAAEVDEIGDGEQALAYINRGVEHENTWPDAIVLDMQMPRLDGYQTASQLRQTGFRSTIIALTADAMQRDVDRCLASGCDAYLSKPIDGDALIGLIAGGAAHASNEDLDTEFLIVEDSVDAATALRELLSLHGHSAHCVYTGGEAIAQAEKLRPTIVLIDLSLPDMSGFEVLEALKSLPALRDTAFIATTGRSEPEDIARCLDAGFDHHAAKPLDITQLLETLGLPS